MRFIGLSLLGLLAACGGSSPGAPDSGAHDATVDATRDAAADASTDAGVDAEVDASTDAGVDPSARLDALLARLSASTLDDAEADAILHEVAWQERWPVSDGARWLFLTRWDGAPANVSLVSDVNAWDTTAAPATILATGHHYLVVLSAADFVSPAIGAKYKWFGSPDVYRAPPEATAYGYDDFGEFAWVAPPTDAAWLERFPAFASAHLEDTRSFRARLPAGFTRAAGPSMRTLFLHDGQNVFDPGAAYGGWHVDDALAAGGYDDVVALAVDNAADRMDAYTPVPDDIGGGTRVGGRADDYLALLEDEALPFFRARYGVTAGGPSFAMMGSSLGGLISLDFALTRDGEAGCVMALSSSLGWGAYDAAFSGADTMVRRWPTLGHGATAVYVDSGGGVTGACADGDGDGVFEDADQTDGFCVTQQFRDALLGLGYGDGVDLFYAWDPGAPHNEGSWRVRVPGALDACASAGWSAP